MKRCFCITVVWLLVATAARSDPAKEPIEPPLAESARRHWSFQMPSRAEPPKVNQQNWVRNPIDAFILAKLEQKRLLPAPQADSLTLLRRVTIDLTGLLPTPAACKQFENEYRNNPDVAYENVVDRLLASEHYGERWAQHWLDVVRYADSNGYEGDGERPSAWRYRDYVVQSLNEDKSFDRFLTEQVAGDEMAAGKDVRANANLWIATGMHSCGPIHIVGGNVDPEENRNEVLTEMVMGIGSAFLGLTMNCARCHDHKFDPISQADYYRLQAFFASTTPKEVDFSLPEERTKVQTKILEVMAKVAPLKAKVAEIDAPYQKRIQQAKRANLEQSLRDALDTEAKKRTPQQQKLAKDAEALLKVTWDEIVAALTPEDRSRRAALREQQHALEAELPMPPSQAWAIVNENKLSTTHILKRGEVKKKGALVFPAFPRIVDASYQNKRAEPPAGLTRTKLAQWLVSPEHPLTARVFVNRLWQHHFGRGLVGTPNDFGARGERPTHPQMLDWLATEFVRSGWKIKQMHRLMVLSNTYRQASHAADFDEKSGKANPQREDPENRLLWKMNRQRLEGETIRDIILVASGKLNREVGGPAVRVPLEPEIYDLIFTEGEPDGLWSVTKDVKQHNRRSLYLFAKRNVRQPLLEAFDQPDSLTPCANRAISTYAPQALILMNGPFAQTQSRAMAVELVREFENNTDSEIEAAYQRCFNRFPRKEELSLAREFLRDQADSVRERLRARMKVNVPENLPEKADLASTAALADFCLALFNTNEFVYRP